MHFTIHPTQLSDGTLVTYAFQKIDFGNRSISQSINAQAANTTTALTSISEANADITNTATTPIPSSQANPDITNTATTPIPSSQANPDITNTATTPIPSSQANPDITNTATTPIPSSQANPDITNTNTTPGREWMLSTKRAINEIIEIPDTQLIEVEEEHYHDCD
ncbi:hypothetical protein CU098_010746 [Rhizopus stolonifer]|uniref:Uncharacterized protein n=1 Tax=Rhizopus stolonifer TaxID=4846 RepID=A0A367K2E1_RHIST|nr:hypothetical protein CU098_010746 [Rhizopus stolonifer]